MAQDKERYVRSDAKAPTAGSTQRQARRLVLPLAVFAALVALMVVAFPASAAKIRLFKETFGSAAQPSFGNAQGIAVDQSTGDVLVMDAGGTPSIKRYNPDGTAANFPALGTNVIDGQGSGDETPQGGLSFSSYSESQIAVDNSGGATDGDIYVTQGFPNVINIFSETGEYLGQLSEKSSGGPFSEACGVAVDPSGAVYVGDYSSGIHKFVPAANPPVNADYTTSFSSVTNPCTLAAGAGPSAGFLFAAGFINSISKLDSSTGEVKYEVSPGSNTTVSVDPNTGNVFAATESTIKEFDASGAGSATSVSSFTLASRAQGVAVNGSSGDIYVSRSGAVAVNVEVFGAAFVTFPDVTTTAASGITPTKATLNGTVNPDGVELTECFFEYGKPAVADYEQTVPCVETPATIGAGTSPVAVHADISALQANGTAYKFRLVAANANGSVNGSNQSFTTLDSVITTAASAVTPTSATLNGTVNPDGMALTECEFEWGVTTSYGETAPCVPSAAGVGSGTSPVAVHADLSGLEVGTVYHYRLRAANANGPILGQDLSLQTLGPVIKDSWSEGVTFTEAILKAQVNPAGLPSTFHFEYGTTTSYGQSTAEKALGSDEADHTVGAFLEGLQPATTYHYRVVATNSIGTAEGPDHTFTTYARLAQDTSCPNRALRSGDSANLPDCRAYEMVSPVDKNGGEIERGFNGAAPGAGFFQATPSGEALAYSSTTSFGDQLSSQASNQYIGTRNAQGWSSDGINPPVTPLTIPYGTFSPYLLHRQYQAFSEDLSSGWLLSDNAPALAGGVDGFLNIDRYDSESDSFEAVTVNEPTEYWDYEGEAHTMDLEFKGASADGSLSAYEARAALTPDASGSLFHVYAFSGGEVHLVSVLPDGTQSPAHSVVGQRNEDRGQGYADTVDRAVSEDGSRIFWTDGSESGPGKIYVRENPTQPQSAISGGKCTEPAKACTIAVSESVTTGNSQFWTASTDGSKAVFQVQEESSPLKGNLYEFDVESETPTLIAGQVTGVVGASEDLSYLYFISKEDLDAGATAGEQNLYLDREGSIEFIATLSAADMGIDEDAPHIASLRPVERNSRVTPDGRHLAFMSTESLTGYDNTDALGAAPDSLNGEADFEVFLYDADAQQLTCASCNPSGARPVGRALTHPFSTNESTTFRNNAQGGIGRIWAAAWIPSWENEFHPSRVLSGDGARLFFNSFDALVPGDTNGVQDVYQWEAQGSGTCQKPGGCVSLISTGQSGQKSEFLDASADGDGVFIRTASSIDSRDPGRYDVYDARVGGGYPIPPSPPACLGDACQSIPSAPNDPTPASAGFKGAGNPPAKKAHRRCASKRRHGKKAKANTKRKQAKKRCTRSGRRANR
jgi:hypothetical protein